MSSIEKLLKISSEPISSQEVYIDDSEIEAYGLLGRELLGLLRRKNGFYAFESALHVFPAASMEQEMTLGQWNASNLWRYEYGELANGKLFFAEDTFGSQFCIQEDGIGLFDAETGIVEFLANTLEGWAERLLKNYEPLTMYPLLHLWQAQEGPLLAGQRLMLKRPLVLGGDYSLNNIFAVESVEGMRLRGYTASQIKDLPDGAQVQFRVTNM